MGIAFRDLRAEEIDVRVQSVTKTGKVILLLYKDARCDMNILDETVGAENWEREHYECKGNLFCKVGIKTGDAWVYKSDCGTESNTEKEKGEASDSFKRACVNWGIGRELYTAPFIIVDGDGKKATVKEDKKCSDNFRVEKIKIENKRITGLAIFNETTKNRAYVYTEKPKEEQK